MASCYLIGWILQVTTKYEEHVMVRRGEREGRGGGEELAYDVPSISLI